MREAMMPMIRTWQVFDRGERRWLATVVALLAACGVAGAVPSVALAGWSAPNRGSQAPAWSVVPSPNRGPGGNALAAVACVSPVACTAVGGYPARGSRGEQRTLAESWDGSRWSVLPSPNQGRSSNALLGVSCVSPVVCMAVGGSGFPSGGAPRLTGIGQRTLAESWDGARWSVLPIPSPGSSGTVLNSVSCASAEACMAVGAFGNSSGGGGTLVESWDGSRWSVEPSPNRGPGGSGLNGVSCVSPVACMAVGSYAGRRGAQRTLAESWDGSRWSVVPTPDPATDDRLNSVSCVSAVACMAVGFSGSRNSAVKTLVESWDGSRWSVLSGRNGFGQTVLNGVSCAAADMCVAVGSYGSRSSGVKTLVESWDGSRWSAVRSPSPGTSDRELDGVSCASATSCTAVGDYYGTNGTNRTFRTLIETGTTGIAAGKASLSRRPGAGQ
jgi:hypothetical protein